MSITPTIIFYSLWTVVLFLYKLELSPIFTQSPNLNIFIVFMYLPLILSFALMIWRGNAKIYIPKEIVFYKSHIFVRIFILLTLIELLLAKNIPMFSLFGIGPKINYVNYGIPGLHGLVNGLHMFLTTLFALQFIYIRKRKYLIYYLSFLIWSMCLVSRQLTLSIFIISFLLYLFVVHKSYLSIRLMLKIFTMFAIVFLTFTFLGNIRSGHEGLATALQFDTETSFVVAGFYWVYAYLISPLHNLLNNLLDIDSLFPLNSFISVFPSFVRSFFSAILMEPLWLQYEIFNVATWFPVFVADFGLFGVSMGAILFPLGQLLIYSKRVSVSLPSYLFISHAAIFSVFANFVLSLPFIFYYVLLIFYLKKCSVL